MKARVPNVSACAQCRQKIYDEYQYEVFATCADSTACGILCMSIWALEMMHKDENEIKAFIDQFMFAASTNKVFNKEVRVEDAMKQYSEKYGINFDELSVNVETKAHFMTRARKGNNEGGNKNE